MDHDHHPHDHAPDPALSTLPWTPRLVDPLLANYAPQAVEMPEAAGYRTRDGRIRISGSEHGTVIIRHLCSRFSALHGDIPFHVDLQGTPTAMAFLTHGKALFCVMGREITPVETVPYRKCVGAPPVEIRVAHAAEDTTQHLATSLAIYVHRSNPLERLTMQQISQAFTLGNTGGDYSRWGQLGLDGVWTNRLIHPVGTPEFTGFGTYMQKHHLGGRPVSRNYESYIGTGAVLARLAEDPAAIAVAAIGRENEHIRLVPIAADDAGPFSRGTTQDVIDGIYPFGRFLYFYIRQEAGRPVDPMMREYLRFVLSREGQEIIAEQPRGYIPLTAAQARNELKKLDRIVETGAN